MACPVKTFVFFDLEATGLSQDLPKVTEICLVAVHISSLENPVTDEAGNVQLPRVLDKLCLCVDPRKTIMEKASSITGLSNKNLDDCEKRPFDLNIIQLIKEFVNRQSQPVCLVAHNGIFYDFPLLKAEFQQQRDDLPTHVLCLDSLKAFRTLDQEDSRLSESPCLLLMGYELAQPCRMRLGKQP
ncbi:hypothetical protein GDO86_000769 [Hymenochirus boettgeri]|uniref:exodeoxyribonuclease III n=1 Tax=Hymenochirus boettgeri TaxID=247094 RepID=A0A8T2KCY5_9PIPI|nr:hypothetical protein GDO86_000769 [Hymenochirus boettgeri]